MSSTWLDNAKAEINEFFASHSDEELRALLENEREGVYVDGPTVLEFVAEAKSELMSRRVSLFAEKDNEFETVLGGVSGVLTVLGSVIEFGSLADQGTLYYMNTKASTVAG